MEAIVVDPLVDPEEAQRSYDLTVLSSIPSGQSWSAVVIAVAHQEFKQFTAEQWQHLLAPNGVLVDLKGLVPRQLEALRL